MNRRLRLEEGPHARVWEISVDQAVITLRSGLENTPGSVRRIERPSPEAALKTAEQLIAQRVADGFRDAPLEAWSAALTPASDDAPWLVYADSLLAQGDPRGELIGLQLRGDEKQAKSLLRKHDEALLGELRGATNQVELEWRHGFISTARLTCEPRRRHALTLPQLIPVLFNSPSIRMLQRLELGWPGGTSQLPSYDDALSLLCHSQWPMHLETLEVGALDAQKVTRWPTLGSLAPIQHRKQLKYLVVRASMGELHRLKHDGLRHVELDLQALTHRVLADVLESELPALRGLVLTVGGDSVLTGRHLTPLASTRFFPELAALGVRQCKEATTFIERMVESGRVAKLALLDISENGLNEIDGRWLLENAKHFEHLARFVVRRNRFKPRMVERLRLAFPRADLEEQA